MKINKNFKTFLLMTPTSANKNPKWIIQGFISGRRNYNKEVMKELYNIMFNVRLRIRDNKTAVYANSENCPFWTDCDSRFKEFNMKDRYLYANNGDNNYYFINNVNFYNNTSRRIRPSKNPYINKVKISYTKKDGSIRKDLPQNHKVIEEQVIIKISSTNDEIHYKRKSNYKLFTLKKTNTNRRYYSNDNYYTRHLLNMKYYNRLMTNAEKNFYTENYYMDIKSYNLKHIASLNCIKGRSKMKKNELFKAIMKLN